MSLTEVAPIQIVEVHTDRGADRIKANLEIPLEGDAVPGFWVPLTGWVLAASGDPVDVQISDQWFDLCRIGRGTRRPDIAAAFPNVPNADQAGFSAALNATRLPEQFDLWLSAVLGGESTRFALVRGTRRRLEPVPVPALSPLIVTTLGRTGSTLMMTLLSRHPAIWAFDPRAFDSRPFAHTLDTATSLAAPGSRFKLLESQPSGENWWLEDRPTPVGQMLALDSRAREVLFGDGVETLLQEAVARAALIARELAIAAGLTAVGFAAEKCTPGHIPRLLHELCLDTKEIFLVRDFRDVLASILAFNAKRGYAAFGRECVGSDLQFVERFARDVDRLAADWMARRGRGHLVRYEELIEVPDEVLGGVLDYLCIDTGSDERKRLVDEANQALARTTPHHATAASPAASSGRWQHDLPGGIQDLATNLLGRALNQFGYA